MVTKSKEQSSLQRKLAERRGAGLIRAEQRRVPGAPRAEANVARPPGADWAQQGEAQETGSDKLPRAHYRLRSPGAARWFWRRRGGAGGVVQMGAWRRWGPGGRAPQAQGPRRHRAEAQAQGPGTQRCAVSSLQRAHI